MVVALTQSSILIAREFLFMVNSQYIIKRLQSVDKLQIIEDGYVNNVSYNMYSRNINVTYKLYNAVSFQQSYNNFFSPERGSFRMKLYLN